MRTRTGQRAARNRTGCFRTNQTRNSCVMDCLPQPIYIGRERSAPLPTAPRGRPPQEATRCQQRRGCRNHEIYENRLKTLMFSHFPDLEESSVAKIACKPCPFLDIPSPRRDATSVPLKSLGNLGDFFISRHCARFLHLKLL